MTQEVTQLVYAPYKNANILGLSIMMACNKVRSPRLHLPQGVYFVLVDRQNSWASSPKTL